MEASSGGPRPRPIGAMTTVGQGATLGIAARAGVASRRAGSMQTRSDQMARRTAALATGGLLTLSLALAACAGAASPNPTSEVLGETSAPETSGPEASEASSSSLPGSSEQGAAEAATCDALQAWSDEMQTLAAMDPSTASVDDVQAQVDRIKEAWQTVKTNLEVVQAADKEAVQAGGAELETALDNLSTDVPVADMVSEVQTAAEPLRGAYQEMANGMGCTLANPY